MDDERMWLIICALLGVMLWLLIMLVLREC